MAPTEPAERLERRSRVKDGPANSGRARRYGHRARAERLNHLQATICRINRHECCRVVIAAVDLFFYDTLFVISPVVLVVLGCASFGLLAGVVMLIYLFLRKRR